MLPPVNGEYSKRLGEPVPALVTTLAVAVLVNAVPTAAALAPGLFCKYNAATPTTCGVAMLVPLIVLVAVSLVFHDDVMLEPGAKISTQVPKLEKLERASVLVVEPTVVALATRAGDVVQAFALLLPAAMP